MALGARLKHHRQRAGYTQRGLGNAVGLSQATIARLESGSLPSLSLTKALDIARVLGIGLDELVGRWETPRGGRCIIE